MISNVEGDLGRVSGTVEYDGKDLQKATVSANIDDTAINTREPNRDAHLKSADFFDSQKYPTISFRSKRILPQANGKFELIGDLTMHGVTKELSLEVDNPTSPIKDPQGRMRIGTRATTMLNRKEFGINFNKKLDNGGALVGDDVSVRLDIELVQVAGTDPRTGSTVLHKTKSTN